MIQILDPSSRFFQIPTRSPPILLVEREMGERWGGRGCIVLYSYCIYTGIKERACVHNNTTPRYGILLQFTGKLHR